MSKKKEKQQRYRIELTKEQMQMLSRSCEWLARLICGQEMELVDLCLNAWDNLQKDKRDWARVNRLRTVQGTWSDARDVATTHIQELRILFWGCGFGEHYGIRYSEQSDFLWDVYQVLRHQLWLDNPDKERWTVDASEAMQTSELGLIKVERIDD